MKPAIEFRNLTLAKRAMYQLPLTAQQITCRSGTLWVTQDDDQRDIILEPGESFQSDGRHRVIVYALAPAMLDVCEASKTADTARRERPEEPRRSLALE